MIQMQVFRSREVQRAFLTAYKGWVKICKPIRIKSGGCAGCVLDNHHWTSICGSFQTIGRAFEQHSKKITKELETKKVATAKDLKEWKDFMEEFDCPGPDLLQSSTETRTPASSVRKQE